MLTPRRYLDQSHLEAIAAELYGGSARAHPEQVRGFARAMGGASQRGYLYQMLSAVGWTSLPWLWLIRQPTLILSGDDDPIIPFANAWIMHNLLPRAQLHVFHGGHLGLVTEADQLAPVVARFLAEGEQQTGMG